MLGARELCADVAVGLGGAGGAVKIVLLLDSFPPFTHQISAPIWRGELFGQKKTKCIVFFLILRRYDGILPPLIFRYDGSLHDAMDLRTILNCIKYIHTF